MAVSITPRNTFINTAIMVDKLAMMSESKSHISLRPLISTAKEIMELTNITPGDELNPDTKKAIARKTSLAQAFMNMNAASLADKYPAQVEALELSVDGTEITPEDFNDHLEFNPNQHALASFGLLVANIDRIRHGHHENVFYSPVSEKMEELSTKTKRAMTRRSIVLDSSGPPSLKEVSNIMTRLNVNGDHLFGADSGMQMMFARLGAISNESIEFYERDLFFKMYAQALHARPEIQVPINGRNIIGDGPDVFKDSSYKLAGDVPFATKEDLTLLSKAVDLLEHRIEKFKVTDEDGTLLTNEQKATFLNNFRVFSTDVYEKRANLISQEMMEFAHLPYAEVSKAHDMKHKAKTESFVLVHLGDLPIMQPPKIIDHSTPESIRHFPLLDHASPNSVAVLSKNEFDKLPQLEGVKAIEFKITPHDKSHLNRLPQFKHSASEYLFTYAIESAYNTVRNKQSGQGIENTSFGKPQVMSGELREQVLRNVNVTLPGLSSRDFNALHEAFSDTATVGSASELSKSLFHTLSYKGREDIRENTASSPVAIIEKTPTSEYEPQAQRPKM